MPLKPWLTMPPLPPPPPAAPAAFNTVTRKYVGFVRLCGALRRSDQRVFARGSHAFCSDVVLGGVRGEY